MSGTKPHVEEPEIPGMIIDVLAEMGLSPKCRNITDKEMGSGWRGYSFRKFDGSKPAIPILYFEHKAQTIHDAKKQVGGKFHCIVLFRLRSSYSLFFKSGSSSALFGLDGYDSCEQIRTVLSSADFASASSKVRARLAVKHTIRNIPTATKNFNNRGVFSTHYLQSRLLEGRDDQGIVAGLEAAWDGDPQKSLKLLGWTDLVEVDGIYRSPSVPHASILIVEKGMDFGMQRSSDGVAPSYRAVAELENAPWVILTDGTVWRLYTSRVSASTTNYFEISPGVKKTTILRYLVAIFGAAAYRRSGGKADIDATFDDGKNYVRELEENLADRILKPDGVFVDLVKGVLDHDWKRRYAEEELKTAKEAALKIMYRAWFLLYAESRDLLPVRDERYASLSLIHLRSSLDSMEDAPEEHGCWNQVLSLFRGIRNGSPRHNLPQYSGELFKNDPRIDNIKMRNKHFVRALRGLLERDGEPVDYASLGVRQLGHVYETLLEFVVRQADRDLMLLEDTKGVREVTSKAESTYTYRKNDIYIISKAGAISRKSSGSYYTPEEIVGFLVRRGLEPIFRERESLVGADLKRYGEKRTPANNAVCMDRLLDIQVLDPAMGSGHFLVEALNQITRWVTLMLKTYTDHPLLAQIEKDRQMIISAQAKLGISINQSLLTHDVLLKRRIMKRCIFGVDANPLAVELARVSLWLDSFAIGVPLTYLKHHIKEGDSTIGSWRNDIGDSKDESLDSWMEATDNIGDIMEEVSRSADVTIEQAIASEDAHDKYERMMDSHKSMLDVHCAAQIDRDVIPGTARRNTPGYIRRFADPDTHDGNMRRTLKAVNHLKTRYKFFHWELEMIDAFVDSRYGFDLIVGNPPWDKLKPFDDEFFTKYYPAFRSLSTKTKKNKKREEVLKDRAIQTEYDDYAQSFRERSAFYKTYKMQGEGDRDMWQLMLERMLNLVSKGGIISVLIPSQILANTGSAPIRDRILDYDVRQMYVFENRKKIFPIHSSYRFLLLTLRNAAGQDSFKAGFYLHRLSSLETDDVEREKFHTMSKRMIRAISPDTIQIPEFGGAYLDILAKMSGGRTLTSESDDGWNMSLSRGFDKTNDADLLKDDSAGWPVMEGKNIHQFNHNFARPEFTVAMSTGLRRERQKRVYGGKCEDFHHSFRLVVRDVSGPTNMRTVVAAIIPPQRFHTNSLRSIILTRNGRFEDGNNYSRHVAYLCGVMNSMPFDFTVRSKIQMHTSTVIGTVHAPPPASITVQFQESRRSCPSVQTSLRGLPNH